MGHKMYIIGFIVILASVIVSAVSVHLRLCSLDKSIQGLADCVNRRDRYITEMHSQLQDIEPLPRAVQELSYVLMEMHNRLR